MLAVIWVNAWEHVLASKVFALGSAKGTVDVFLTAQQLMVVASLAATS